MTIRTGARIGPRQHESIAKFASKINANYQVYFRVGTYRPYTREFGVGYPVRMVIEHNEDPEDRLVEELTLLPDEWAAKCRVQDFYAELHEVLHNAARND